MLKLMIYTLFTYYSYGSVREIKSEKYFHSIPRYLLHVDFNGSPQASSPFHNCSFQAFPAVVLTVHFGFLSFHGICVVKSSTVFFCLHIRCPSFTSPDHLKIEGNSFGKHFLSPLSVTSQSIAEMVHLKVVVWHN